MYMTVMWETPGPTADFELLDSLFLDILANHLGARALNRACVVSIEDADEVIDIVRLLTEKLTRKVNVYFLETPLVREGSYDGFLPESRWGAINEITDD